MSQAPSNDPPRPFWAARAERGTAGALRLVLRLISLFGRRGAAVVVAPVALYFWATDKSARAASGAYFSRLASTERGRAAFGHEPGWRDGYHHIHAFAWALFDRVCVWADLGDVEVSHEGAGHFAHLPDLPAEQGGNALGKSGALIVTAHVGSFDMMRAASMDKQVPVHVVMYGDNAETINGFLDALNPALQLDLIHVRPGSTGAALEIRAAITRGDFVAIMGDRIGLDPGGKKHASFLGAPAPFSPGPFELAAAIGCPVLMATTLRTGDGHYRVRSWPIYPGGRVPRNEREQVVQQMIERYAEILESAVCEAPYQWFNFFDFWDEAKVE
jgi:predicted LPLAT superfamily acyltransferase